MMQSDKDEMVPLATLHQEIREVYLASDRDWIVAYSGGKDSTATLQLIWYAVGFHKSWAGSDNNEHRVALIVTKIGPFFSQVLGETLRIVTKIGRNPLLSMAFKTSPIALWSRSIRLL